MYYLFQNIFCQGSNSTLTSSCNENINKCLSVYFLAFICCHFKISNLRITHLLYQASVELFYLKHFFISFCFTYFELIDFWIESCKKVNSRPVYCLFLGENIIGRDVACKVCIPLKVNMFISFFICNTRLMFYCTTLFTQDKGKGLLLLHVLRKGPSLKVRISN